jgi:hypothetical protein
MLTGEKLGAALVEAMRLKGVTPTQLGREFGIKTPSVYDWTKHGRVAKKHIDKLVHYFLDVVPPDHWGISVEGGMAPSPTAIAPRATNPGYVRFPLLEGFAGMGRGDYVGDYPEIVEFVEVTREWVEQKLRGVPVDAVRIITGRGDSMRGQYNDGDLVFVDSRVKFFDADSAYCYRWNGRVQIKRLQLIGKGKVRILSENKEYPPIDVSLEELEIGGRAIAAWTLRDF